MQFNSDTGFANDVREKFQQYLLDEDLPQLTQEQLERFTTMVYQSSEMVWLLIMSSFDRLQEQLEEIQEDVE